MTEFDHISSTEWVPLFPLPRCVLFPGVGLPLHVFEPRYRSMISDIIEQPESDRWIAIGLLRSGHENTYQTKQAPVHPVVCVGQLIQSEPLEDGRFNILVVGQWRAVILEEDREREYRRVRVAAMAEELAPDAEDPSDALEPVVKLLHKAGDDSLFSQELIEQITLAAPSPEVLLDALVFHLMPGLDSELKQRILEEPQIGVRAEIFTRWLEQWIAAAKCIDPEAPWPPPVSSN